MLPLLLAAVTLFSSCAGLNILDPFGINDDDAFNPLNMNTIKEPAFVDYKVSRLLYGTLTEKEKQAYRRIYNSVLDHPAKIVIPALAEDELSRVFLALKFDNPQILCLKNTYTYYCTESKFYILPEYCHSVEECGRMCSGLIDAAKKICDKIPARSGEYEKELYLHDALIERAEYSDGKNSDTAYGALVDGKAACGGYALACKLLFDMAGIQSVAVSGETTDMSGGTVPHMWLAASINNNWYFVDPAWDDPVGSVGTLRHTYFNVNETELMRTHSGYTLPEAVSCCSDSEDYFIKSDMLASENGWEEKLERSLKNIVRLPAHVELRFESAKLLEASSEKLFDRGTLSDLLKKNTVFGGNISVSHSTDNDRSVLHIYIRQQTER